MHKKIKGGMLEAKARVPQRNKSTEPNSHSLAASSTSHNTGLSTVWLLTVDQMSANVLIQQGMEEMLKELQQIKKQV